MCCCNVLSAVLSACVGSMVSRVMQEMTPTAAPSRPVAAKDSSASGSDDDSDDSDSDSGSSDDEVSSV